MFFSLTGKKHPLLPKISRASRSIRSQTLRLFLAKYFTLMFFCVHFAEVFEDESSTHWSKYVAYT
ncbi:MAG: hypothetical protein KA327_02465 [Pseudarcicella sp.]|nr:hypothetical protein [Pseudarcicella sp.]